jgi:membrane protease YdiL (CAAX protease family)
MLPALQRRMNALDASIVIGLFHGAWHLPAYGVGAVLLTLFTVSGAVVFTWMYNRTGGNLFLPALMHATANASLPFLETLVPAIDRELLFPLLVFGVWVAIAGMIVWRVGRDGLDPRSETAPQHVARS